MIDAVLSIRKEEVDRAALAVAEQWMPSNLMEYTFMSRFLHSIPYKVYIFLHPF
jgi:hypothetical protein